MDRASAEELQLFPGATVASAAEVPGPGANQVTRARILTTDFKYPNVRTEEVVDSTTGAVVVREVMVADHLLVTLTDNVTPDAILAKLGDQALSMERVTPEEPLFRLHLAEASLEALPAALDESSALSGTMSVEPDYILQSLLTPNDPKYLDGTLWGMNQVSDVDIDAPEGWAIRTSASAVIVAVIDTGIRATHQDLAANMWRNPNETAGNGRDDDANGFVDDLFGCDAYNNDGDPTDDNGHGTHCAGTIGGVGNNGIGVTGVAWNVKLMACKFLSASGSGATSDAVRCIDYARLKGAKILSNSWGGGGASSTLQAAIERARAAGMIFVAAAGNNASNSDTTPSYPASYATDNIVSVAATNRLDALSSFSNYGATSVDLGAPGELIYSTVSTSDSSYATYSGTSMATPHVSGVLSVLAAQYPADTYTALIGRLYAATDKIAALKGKTKTGGRLNLAKALQAATPPAPVPPANDAFGAAVGVTSASWALTGNNTNATSEVSEPSHAGNAPAKSVWWTWSAPSAGTCTLRTAGSTFDTVLAVYAGSSVGLLTPVASNDNTSPAVTDSTVSFTAVKGAVYRIAVDGKSGASGAIALAGSIVVPAGPANDSFAAASACAGTSISGSGTNVLATSEIGEPRHAGVSGGKSVWWVWTAPSSGALTLSTAGSSYDTTLALYSGTAVNALTLLRANDDQSSSVRYSLITAPVVAGTTYHIAVDGYNGAAGNIVMSGSLAVKVPLVAPASVSGIRDALGRVTISWSAVPDAVQYEINLSSGTAVYVSVVTGTTARTAGLMPKGVVLSAKVRARDALGATGPWSALAVVR